MIESLKRFTMALLFVYLGGVLVHTATAISFGAAGILALKVGVMWPEFVSQVICQQIRVIF